MGSANIIRGEFFEGSDVRIMARIVRHDNVVLAPGDCTAGLATTLSVYDLNSADPSASIFSSTVAASTVVFTNGTVTGWTVDSIGANFLWIAKVGAGQVWPAASNVVGGHRYRFEAKIPTTNFGTVMVVAELACKSVLSS